MCARAYMCEMPSGWCGDRCIDTVPGAVLSSIYASKLGGCMGEWMHFSRVNLNRTRYMYIVRHESILSALDCDFQYIDYTSSMRAVNVASTCGATPARLAVWAGAGGRHPAARAPAADAAVPLSTCGRAPLRPAGMCVLQCANCKPLQVI